MDKTDSFELKGWHVFAGFVLAFGVIIGVNLTLAINAVRTFPGLEVKNSYVASQQFDARRIAQESLGWTVRAEAETGEVILRITDANGDPLMVGGLQAVIGRATHIHEDVEPEFTFRDGAYRAPLELGGGNWNIRMTALSRDGTEFSQRVVLHVKR